MVYQLKTLTVYLQAKELSSEAWIIHNKLVDSHKRMFGEQFVRSTDSVAANIAEGYGRFHYLDKIKFFYNARGSLYESYHWFETIVARIDIDSRNRQNYLKVYNDLPGLLNGFIKSTYKNKYIE